MTPEQRRAICQIRLERAYETLQDAQMLINGKRWRSAMNRIYYSMFYAVSALANAQGFSTSKHATLEGWFNKNIVHSKLIAEEIGNLYRQVFDLRSKGDYDDTVNINPVTIQKFYASAEPFIKVIQRLTLEQLDKWDERR